MRHTSSEIALVSRLRAGDESAFAEIVERYHAQLVRLASTFVGSVEAAEDAAQETWIALITGIERFEGRASLRTWLFQVCANRARRIGVREHRVVPVDHIDSAVDAATTAPSGVWTTAASPPAAADHLVDVATVSRIRAAISDLPALQQAVVTLRDVDGLPAPQVCQILSISPTNQRVLLHRGRERVRRELSRVVTRCGSRRENQAREH